MSWQRLNRRHLLRAAGASLVTVNSTRWIRVASAQEKPLTSGTVVALDPRDRIPLSFIIDDSTCLVNMGHFCVPQFAEAWPERAVYKQKWQAWPREIPDTFVREFGEWCGQHGVKGKYSIVPYPACVGWLDRTLPGWSKRDLDASLKLVRELMTPNWDIHPEMITHTRVIDLKTGRPMEEATAATMENSYPQTDISVDHLTEYLAFALQILKNCGLECEGITTPGGFGNRVKTKLPVAVHQAVRDVYGSELPHYFKYVVSGQESTAPKLEFTSDQKRVSDLTVNVPAGTGDWFGSWEGSKTSEPDRYCSRDATAGRMVELIERGEPAVMLCHWPGMYCNGTKSGFEAFQRVVTSLHSRFADQTIWMKVSEIGRYWAARELTTMHASGSNVTLEAPLSCRDFTIATSAQKLTGTPRIESNSAENGSIELRRVESKTSLAGNTYFHQSGELVACMDLPKGSSRLIWGE